MIRCVSLLLLFFLFVVGTYADTSSDLNPNSSNTWNKKAYDLQNLQKYDEALTAADQATQLDPNNTHAWNTKASILIKLKRYDEAFTALDHSVQIDLFDSMAYRLINSIKEKSGKSDEFIENDLVKKANLLQNSKKMDEALTVINQAIEQDPSNTKACQKR